MPQAAAAGCYNGTMKCLVHFVVALAAFAGRSEPVRAADVEPLVRMTFRDEAGQAATVEGKVVVEAVDGGVLLMGRDGRLRTLSPKNQLRREATDRAFSRFTPDELARSLQDELGPRFEIVRTSHYVIAAAPGAQDARACGELFERLLSAFLAHWKERGMPLREPAWPLAAVIFADEQTFRAHAATDAGPFGAESKGYYSIKTDRIVLYDLIGGKKKSRAKRSEKQRRSAVAAFNLATIVHEATHQIAFNSGMHTRFADNPVWLTEGMAMYFETADLEKASEPGAIGKLNRPRFDRFAEFVRRRRKRDSLVTLISRSDRFEDSRKAADAYAEAWALTWFLSDRYPKEYARYLSGVAKKPPLIWDSPEARVAEFQAAFGDDLSVLDAEFVKFMKARPAR